MTKTAKHANVEEGRQPVVPADELSQLLRRAMRGIAATVTVITAGKAGERYAMAATSFTPLSLDPPSVLFCINRESTIYQPLQNGLGFCVNVLMQQHEALARACGNSNAREERFEAGDFATDEFGVPFLRDAQSTIHCQPDGRYLYGTHAIFIGRARTVRIRDEIDPLVYVNGRYGGVGGHLSDAVQSASHRSGKQTM